MSKQILKRIAQELVPEPTLRRLLYIRAAIYGPRDRVLKDLSGLSMRFLSPRLDAKLRAFALRVLKRPTADNIIAPVPVVKKHNRGGFIKDRPVYFAGQRYVSTDELVASGRDLKCDVAVVCAFLHRHEVLELMANEATAVPDGYRCIVCLVGSSEEDEKFLAEITAKNHNVVGMVTENKPVGRKWQAAVDLARATTDFALLSIMGSDDIIPSKALTMVIDKDRAAKTKPFSTALYGTLEWLVLSQSDQNNLSPQMVKCSYRLETAVMPLGAGRFYSRGAMDHVDGDIFEVSRNRHLDPKGYYKARDTGFGVENFLVTEFPILSLKGDWGTMNSFDRLLTAATVSVEEYSFAGYALLKDQLTTETFNKIFKIEAPKT